MAPAGPYAGRQLCLTTHHGKQRALARAFRSGLGAELLVSDCDTDQLGSFSGEVERSGDALSTCRRKAELGLERSGLSLGLASEGSFGPHPTVPLLSAGVELLVFLDRERQLEVVEQQLELRTNYSRFRLEPGADPGPWLERIGFPGHAVIVRPEADPPVPCVKGIQSVSALERAIAHCRSAAAGEPLVLDTDMRAHLNPTRMASIRRLGFKLVRRLASACPACGAPGWGRSGTRPGLPCGWCGSPTELVAADVWGCGACDHQEERPRADGRQQADPGHCPYCNP
ncbi:MAG: DUF6671 family protein [Cyanobacteriota bacterium]